MGAKGHVLLVEDDENDRTFFSLARRGTRIPVNLRHASDGNQAIDYLAGRRQCHSRERCPIPQLIVLDLRTPGMDGFGFLKWHASSPFNTIPVVVLKGSGDQADKAKASQMGARPTLTKPHRLADLHLMIAEMLATVAFQPPK